MYNLSNHWPESLRRSRLFCSTPSLGRRTKFVRPFDQAPRTSPPFGPRVRPKRLTNPTSAGAAGQQARYKMSGNDAVDASYAPRSPDLSSFYAGAGPTQPPPASQHHLQIPPASHPQPHSQPSIAPAKHASYAYSEAGTPLSPHRQAYEPFQHDSQHSRLEPHQIPPAHAYHHPSYDSAPPIAPVQAHYAHHDYGAQPVHYQAPLYAAHAEASHPQLPGGLPYQGTFRPSHTQPQIKAEPSASDFDFDMPGTRASAAAAGASHLLDPSPVRTRFPTARIKRIMQADEEVGKVAQQTPIAVGKALELFMMQLVLKSAEVAKDKGSKRVTAPMLKQVVETDEQWDFLREIVSRVEHEKEGSKSKLKAESESEDEPVEPKKKGRGARRRKAS